MFNNPPFLKKHKFSQLLLYPKLKKKQVHFHFFSNYFIFFRKKRKNPTATSVLQTPTQTFFAKHLQFPLKGCIITRINGLIFQKREVM